jgi:hypothetical protein
MSNIVKVTVGDWSKDGHNQDDDFYVEVTNCDRNAKNLIEQAYKTMLDDGTPDITKMCEEYEDNHLDAESAIKLLELVGIENIDGDLEVLKLKKGKQRSKYDFNYSDWDYLFENGDDLTIENIKAEVAKGAELDIALMGPDPFFSIWLLVVNKGMEKMGIPARLRQTNNDTPVIRIGGYGLYSG